MPPGAVSTVIGEDRYALVMRGKHPAAAKKWTVAEYANWESVVVSIFGDGASDVDARLAKAGVARRIGLSTPHFMASLAAVSTTDMIATTSHLFATRYAQSLSPHCPRDAVPRNSLHLDGDRLRHTNERSRHSLVLRLVTAVSEAVRHKALHGRARR